ncbi:MAG: DNA mismatch repair protein MutS, partial [Spirochaetia bacterium]|nr:DNA mismatch repair protein MutS [Spirochaetia bacterium]
QLKEKIKKTVREELPAVFGNGPFLREGVDEKLDLGRKAMKEGAEWILQFEEEERKRTGINTLKVKYNRVAGYFIEMSRNQAKDAPDDYRRTQTLVGNERFTCDRLQELEIEISSAEQTVSEIEEKYFQNLCGEAVAIREHFRRLMMQIAELDFFVSLAEAAYVYKWRRPEITEEGFMEILGGRHPVVEKYLPPGDAFIPNDLLMNEKNRTFSLITGPNMAGKSTYIRQIGILQLLMQIGSFVPAELCRLSIVDCIFTRIGASDNLTRGESTFYVEMLETARILNRCTERSLVIMDEVGRGTSTYDGLSIAWAIVEHLTESDVKRPKVLFATHYHELTVLKDREGVFNLTMEVDDSGGQIVFLHKIREGQADRSYGIHVAKLAGIPEKVISRAEEKLEELESRPENLENSDKSAKKSKTRAVLHSQPGLF